MHTEEDQGWAPSSYLEKEDGSQDVRILIAEDQAEGRWVGEDLGMNRLHQYSSTFNYNPYPTHT